MKKFLTILQCFFVSIFVYNSSNAEECDFYDIKIGDNFSEAKEYFGEPSAEISETKIDYLETEFTIICPEQGLEDATVKIFLIGERIGGFFIESYIREVDSKNETTLIYHYIKNNYKNYAKIDDLNWEGGTYWTVNDGRVFYYNKAQKQDGSIIENLLITNSEFSKYFWYMNIRLIIVIN